MIGAVVVGGVSVLGGSGNVVGAALGAIVLTTMDNGLILIGTHEVIRQLLYGVAIVGAADPGVDTAADVLRIPRGTVKSRLSRALGRLRDHLTGVEA